MTDYIHHLNDNPVFNHVARSAKDLQMPVFVVGGYVRDLILKRPSKDIDFVTLGDSAELALAVSDSLGKQYGRHFQVSIFKNFGTAMVKYDDWELEFVTARKESYNPDSRKPTVEKGSLTDDQLRRDFTINALAISLNNENYGELIDPFEGMRDLEQKILRTPTDPSITFSDDPLRMMRGIRFAAQLNFDIDADTFTAIQAMAERLDIISAERITTELNKIILSAKPSYGFKLLYHAGLLNRFFPEMVALLGAQNMEGHTHKDNFYHTLEVLDNVSKHSTDLWLRWAAILHDIAKPATKRFDPKHGWTFHGHEEKGAKMVPVIFRRMRLPLHEDMRFVRKLVRLHLRPIALVKETVTDSAIRRIMVDAGPDLEALMLLCRADITTKNPDKARKYLTNFDKVEQKMREVEERDKLRTFQPVVTGEIVMHLFGLKPGPLVGELKLAIRQIILDGDVENTLEAAIPVLLAIAKTKNLELIEKPLDYEKLNSLFSSVKTTEEDLNHEMEG